MVGTIMESKPFTKSKITPPLIDIKKKTHLKLTEIKNNIYCSFQVHLLKKIQRRSLPDDIKFLLEK